MALFDWLRRLVTPVKPQRPRHRNRGTAPIRQQPASTPSTPPVAPEPQQPVKPVATPTTDSVPVTATRTHAQPDATLVVRLVDTHDRPLQPALILTGRLGTPVHLATPQIPGYTFLRIDGLTQDFTSAYGLTTIIYQRKWGHPIITYLVDYDSGQLLALPQVVRGQLNTDFHLTPPPITGYHIFQAQGDQQGQFGPTAQRMIYLYRRDAWQTVQRVRQYVTLTADHQVYDEPAGRTYGYQFPATSLWRLFAIITLTDQSVWYNLGGNQWLNAVDTDRHEHWSRTLQLPPKITTWQTQADTQLAGVVDYVPNDAVTIYREPYGEVAGQLANGELLDIRRRLVDDQNLVWYQVGPEAYINARYVRLAQNL